MGYRRILNITLTDTQFRVALIIGNMVILETPVSAIRAVAWKNGFISDTITVNYKNQHHQQKWFTFQTGNRTSWVEHLCPSV